MRKETKNLAIIPLVKGHNSRTIIVTLYKFKLDLFSIMYKYQNIWLRHTKVQEQKRKIQQFNNVQRGITLD